MARYSREFKYQLAQFIVPITRYFAQDQAALAHTVPEEAFIWGRVDTIPYCLYLNTEEPENWRSTKTEYRPAYVCLSRLSRSPDDAWELTKFIAERNLGRDTAEHTATHIMQKMFLEHDFRTIYHYMLHNDRKADFTRNPNDWTEASFITHLNDYVRFWNPLLRITPAVPIIPLGSNPIYLGDPLKRRAYPSSEIVQVWYRIERGMTSDKCLRSVWHSTTIPIALHVRKVGSFFTYRLFHSRDFDFDKFYELPRVSQGTSWRVAPYPPCLPEHPLL